MDQALARFEQYLKRRFGRSSTPIHYLSDLKIFIQISNNNKKPETVTAADIDHFVDQQIAAGRGVPRPSIAGWLVSIPSSSI